MTNELCTRRLSNAAAYAINANSTEDAAIRRKMDKVSSIHLDLLNYYKANSSKYNYLFNEEAKPRHFRSSIMEILSVPFN